MPDTAAWLHDYSSMSPARTGRPSFSFKRIVSAACSWFNFCFLLHNSPENCWRDHVGPFLSAVSSPSGRVVAREGLRAWDPGACSRDLGKGDPAGVALGTASLPVLTVVCCRSLLFLALSYWKSFKTHENRAEFPDPLLPASSGDDP